MLPNALPDCDKVTGGPSGHYANSRLTLTERTLGLNRPMLTDAKIAALKLPDTGQDEHPDTKVTGLRLRIGAGGARTWTVRRRIGGKVVNRKLGTYPVMKLAEARRAAERLIEALERDGSAELLDRTFGELGALWLEQKAIPNNINWKGQKRQLELHVYPAWRDRKVDDIKRRDVRELIDGIEGSALPNRVLALIKTIFQYAMRRDWVEVSPAIGVDKPRKEISRDRVLTMPEAASIWTAADLLGFPYGPYIRILMLTGQRRAEVAGMRWKNIDLDAATWTIPATDTKAERGQLVPLSEPVVKILRTLPNLGEHVFTTNGKTPISGFGKAKGRLDKYLESMGRPVEGWRLHDLRRSAATHMVRLGVAEAIVSRVLNHAAVGVTAQVYALHSYAPEKREALDVWADEVLQRVGSEA